VLTSDPHDLDKAGTCGAFPGAIRYAVGLRRDIEQFIKAFLSD
jgi:hypothetical protein